MKKVGRPRKLVKDKKIRTVFISDSTHEYFFCLGNGNFSKGLEEAKNLLIKLSSHLESSKKIK